MTKEQILNALKQEFEGAAMLATTSKSNLLKQYHDGRRIGLKRAYELVKNIER